MSVLQENLWPDDQSTDPREVAQIYNAAAQTYAAGILKDGWINTFNMLSTELPSLLTGSTPKDHFSILDAGCGVGLLADHFDFGKYSVTLYGIDIAEEMLSIAMTKGKYDHLQIACLADKLPFGDNLFDLFISNGVLGYCEDSEPLHEIMRVLKPGGHLMMNMRKHHFVDRGYPKTLLELQGRCELVKRKAFSAFPNNPQYKHEYNFFLIKKL